jgi:hypothetical protein
MGYGTRRAAVKYGDPVANVAAHAAPEWLFCATQRRDLTNLNEIPIRRYGSGVASAANTVCNSVPFRPVRWDCRRIMADGGRAGEVLRFRGSGRGRERLLRP